MKRFILAIVVIVLTITSCYHDRIDGNGRISTEDRTVDEFDEIYAEGVFNIILIQDDQYGVEVETDNNLQDIVIVYSRHNKLYLDFEENVNVDATRMNIYVYSPDFRIINCDGVVNLSSDNTLESESIEITNNGVGNIKMDVDCEDLDVYLNGVGNIRIDGYATNLNLRHNGVGDLDTYDLPADYVNIVNSGVGNSEIYVLNELDVTISGVGNVYYKGNPEYINSTITGVGRLKHR